MYIIEDVCQVFGVEFEGKKVGIIGDVGCFLFFFIKNLGGFGDGGLIVIDFDEIVLKVRMFR